jgi:hypothetical protein
MGCYSVKVHQNSLFHELCCKINKYGYICKKQNKRGTVNYNLNITDMTCLYDQSFPSKTWLKNFDEL